MCVHGQTQHDLLEVADAFPRAHRQGEGGPWWSQCPGEAWLWLGLGWLVGYIPFQLMSSGRVRAQPRLGWRSV